MPKQTQERSDYLKGWYQKNRARVLLLQRKHVEILKREVLAHYGLGGKAVCNWAGCGIDDVDLLTLDHVNNDGGAHRKASKNHHSGRGFYHRLRSTGYPPGIQTLCWNHNLKKELLRKRAARIEQPSPA